MMSEKISAEVSNRKNVDAAASNKVQAEAKRDDESSDWKRGTESTYNESVKDAVRLVHKEVASKYELDPSAPEEARATREKQAQEELEGRVASTVAKVRRTYAGLPLEQIQDPAERLEERLKRRMMERSASARYREDVGSRRVRRRHVKASWEKDVTRARDDQRNMPRTYEAIDT
jgi:hypothetical protein